MSQKLCKNKKCQRPLPEGYKYKYCEHCRSERAQQIKRAGKAALGVVVMVGGTAVTVLTKGKIKHQGVTSRQLGEKLLSVTQVSKDSDDSERQIQRYIRLTYLIPELLSMVDDNKIAFNPAVEISYLDREEQLTLLDAINMNDCTPSHAQSIRLKKMSQDGLLTADGVYAVLSEEKPNQREQIKLPRDELRKYFPQNYSDEQIKRDILKGLELLKRQRERNRDAR